MNLSAIVPAAGLGARMGQSVPKQFLQLNGQSILRHTVNAFEKSGLFKAVVLVAPATGVDAARRECEDFNVVSQVVPGGERRQDSVYEGLKVLDEDVDIVVVHDAVRPFLSRRMIEEVVDAAREHGAAITAIPVSDTVKLVNEQGFVDRTIDREGLWRVQTPQAFRYPLLKQALEQAARDSYVGTDEGTLLEHIGKSVKIIPGSERNIKITQPEDLLLGESIAAAGNYFEDGS
ncbi:MAG: 2-C-methyl-D-erythritol 4-phosphate cytidylyltransferase [Nitrospinota bacterium]|nr:2-C-methyl-D-erythritol 4-phosphate cytidylyltransferase [Nitrospinota bacterium]